LSGIYTEFQASGTRIMRRNSFDARGAQPQGETALELIGRVYEVEEQIRARGLAGQAKQQYRA
jgi:hypothetical protein